MRTRLSTTVSAIALGLALGAPVQATSETMVDLAGVNTLVQFNFAEAPLSDILLEFTDLTGLGLVFDSRLVANKTAPELKGEYSAKVALDLLLEGSGLNVVDVGGDTLAIVPVRAKSEAGAETPDAGMPQLVATDFAANTSAIVDELLILGTRTANPPYHKFKPTVALSGEKLQFGGNVNVSDYLFQLPSMLSDITAANTTIFGTPAGLNLADLRGVGSERTLVLINGRRVIPTFGGSLTLYGVDLNSIPSSLVERIDVINGGAATSFGTEAVAGVVNFTLRDDIEGWSGAVQAGVTGNVDRGEVLATLTYGNKFADGRGNFLASLTVDDQSGLYMSDRDVTANPSGFALNGRKVSPSNDAVFTPGFGGSSFTPSGVLQGVFTTTGALHWFDTPYSLTDGGGDIEPSEARSESQFSTGNVIKVPRPLNAPKVGSQFVEPITGRPHQLYNYAKDQTLMTPLNRVFGTMNMTYDLGDGHRVFMEGNFADTDVVSQLAAIPLAISSGLSNDDGKLISVPLSNPYVPDAVRELVEDIPDADSVLLSRRMTELGPRRTYIKRQTLRALVGVQGMVMPGWSYDAYYQYGRNDVSEERDGLLDVLNYRAAIDPDLCAETAGCSVIDPFGNTEPTDEQLAFIKAPNAFRKIVADQHVVSAVVSGPADFFADLDGKITLGLEYRYESLHDQPDEALDDRPVSGSLIFPGSEGSFDVFEAFADVTLPLLSGEQFAEELTATFGARVSDFSSTGTIVNWHAGGLWAPVDGLALRLSYQAGRRAPNIAELYAGGPGRFEFYEDPCSGLEATDTGVIADNCRSDGPLGVPEGFVQTSLVVDAQSFGNPNLNAERSSSLTWGGSYETDDIWGGVPGRVRLSFDAYRIDVKNYIVNLDAFQILDACYGSEDFDYAFCGTNPVSGRPYIERDLATSNLSVVTSSIINAGRFNLKGFDIELQYVGDLKALGLDGWLDQISLTGLYTRNLGVTFQSGPEAAEESYLGSAKYPRHRFQAGVSVTHENLTIDWDVRYRGKAVSYTALEDLDAAQLKAVWYHDLSARVAFDNGSTIYGGVRNLLGQKGPRVYGGSIGDTFPEFYDTLGRRFFVGVVFDF